MTSKDSILNSIKSAGTDANTQLPDHNIEAIVYDDLNTQFSEALHGVGGKAVFLESIADIESKARELYPDASDIVCNVAGCAISSDNGNSAETPHSLASVNLAVIKGEFAVAENGAVWVQNPDNRHRALYFLAENSIIVVETKNIVATMHDAYERIDFTGSSYGTFISGPSKTADIEQSLVIGAHGPKSGYVFFV